MMSGIGIVKNFFASGFAPLRPAPSVRKRFAPGLGLAATGDSRRARKGLLLRNPKRIFAVDSRRARKGLLGDSNIKRTACYASERNFGLRLFYQFGVVRVGRAFDAAAAEWGHVPDIPSGGAR